MNQIRGIILKSQKKFKNLNSQMICTFQQLSDSFILLGNLF